MAKCTTRPIHFTSCKSRLVQAHLSGGDITSDGGVLLKEIDRQLQLTSSISRQLTDNRRKKQVQHDYLSLIRQRVYAICLGYEDLNDHDTLRTDPLIQKALGKDQTLARSATLCRFENHMGRQEALAIQKVLIDKFIAFHCTPPKS